MNNFHTMRNEFEAAHYFAHALDRLHRSPIVDDDYPQVRHEYESALEKLIEAMKANGRFDGNNLYGLVPRETATNPVTAGLDRTSSGMIGQP